MKIIHYSHPTLRHRSKPLKRVDAHIQKIVEEMLELMYEAKGIGLAANQVDLPYRLFVMNPTSDPEQQDQQFVAINPVITKPKGTDEAEEGCLSLPGLYAQVKRPEKIHLNAYDLAGNEINVDLDGVVARIVQHETDHLDGVLFIDKLGTTAQLEVKEALSDFELEFKTRRACGEIPNDQQITARLAELEQKYCQ